MTRDSWTRRLPRLLARKLTARLRGGRYCERDGSERWLDRQGRLHRVGDRPALVDGALRHWYEHGLLHRAEGPAVVHQGVLWAWYRQGKRHREGAPAVIASGNARCWHRHGLLHRADGPAVIRLHDCSEEWWCEGTLLKVVNGFGSEFWHDSDGALIPAELVAERARAWAQAATGQTPLAVRRSPPPRSLRSLLGESR